MKDKRQRMAMAWPYPDPHLAAYMLNAAAAAGVYPGATGLPMAAPPFYYEAAWRAALTNPHAAKMYQTSALGG